ncbi:hypothetical protein Y032_0004g2003 [Ancylostoma ceylanicum]|uniref:Uncharacterized protein n=1 Tax=Ancylostoma ceylanicum TaxID=53326 RepID=A0A016VWQ3_9BILA|nr:hypothetical protein Y032_0004g2003 [Ancylostoma ceylanicum]
MWFTYTRSPLLVTGNHVGEPRESRQKLKVQGTHPTHLEQLLAQIMMNGRIDCVPRADVVFIRFHSQPDDPWAIDQIDVNLFFLVDRGGRQPYNWHFEHAVLMPCSSWLKETHMYQIGPRNGLFIEHPYLYMPKPGEWVRDWV